MGSFHHEQASFGSESLDQSKEADSHPDTACDQPLASFGTSAASCWTSGCATKLATNWVDQ